MTDDKVLREQLIAKLMPLLNGFDAMRAADEVLPLVRAAARGSQWQPMETAPEDEPIIVLTKGGSVVLVSWCPGLVDSDEEECGGWAAVNDGEHPPSWTDGVCWGVNEDDEESDQPIGWLPSTPRAAEAVKLTGEGTA